MQLILAFLTFISALQIVKADIFTAISSGDVKKIEKELQLNPGDLNKIGSGGQSPLMNAVLSGKTEIVKFLLQEGADVTIGEQDGYTPMHGAGFQGRAEIAQILLDHGLSGVDFHKDGFAPIHRACWGKEQRHADTVEIFLKSGIPVGFKSMNGKSCRAMTQNVATIALIKKYKEQSKKSNTSSTGSSSTSTSTTSNSGGSSVDHDSL